MRPRVLFLTSNGWGLGHLTRSMAMARRLPRHIQPVFLTLSQALPVTVAQGFIAEYMVSSNYSGIPVASWNAIYARRLRHLLHVYDPAVVVFDGTFPYGGLRTVITEDEERAFVWSRRAMWRSDYKDDALAMADLFDLVIEPGEFAADADRGATVAVRHQAVQVAPVVLLDREELASREDAAAELGLEAGRTNVLVQLGAGNINDTSSETGMVVERLRGWPDTQVVVAESTIAATPLDLPDDVRRARTYPLSRLLRAFDLTVTATGYNTFHEALAFAVPSLYVPNDQTMADDQVARAMYAEREGVGLTWLPKTPERLDAILAQLADPGVRDRMVAHLRARPFANGAVAAARLIADLVEKQLAAPAVGVHDARA